MFGKNRSKWSQPFTKSQRHFPQTKDSDLFQIRRVGVSVPANIAEGAARQSDKEFCQFLSIAQGSASELETELLIARNLRYLSAGDYDRIYEQINVIARMIVGLSKTVRNRIGN